MIIIKIKPIIKAIVVPLIVGGLSALISMRGMKEFENVIQPPLSPPSWLFAPVWTILYILMGIASYLVINSDSDSGEIRNAMKVYALSLIFNFFWSIVFFNFNAYLFAFIWLLALLVIVVYLFFLYYKISKSAAYMLIPYILWMLFALYLNYGVYLLN